MMSTLLVLLLAVAGVVLGEEGLVDDLEVDVSDRDVAPGDLAPILPPRKLRGVPDVTAEAGKLLRFQIPQDAFVGDVDRIEVKNPLPPWLSYSTSSRTFVGIPLSTDKPDALISVAAYGPGATTPAQSVFRVHVRRQPATVPCSNQPLVLTIYLDRRLDSVKPQQRVTAVHNIASFLGINISAFTLGAQKHYSETLDSSVILGGPGDVKKQSSKHTSNIDLLVGCGNKLDKQYISLPQQLREQAADGTLTEVLGLPVLSWRVESPQTLERGRRETPLSQDDLAEYYDEYDDYEDSDYDEGITTIIPKISEATTPATTSTNQDSESHPHRHHHGELPKEDIPDVYHTEKEEEQMSTTILVPSSRPPIPITTQRITTAETTTKSDSDYYTIDEDDEDLIDDYDESETEVPVAATEPPVIKNTYSSTSGSTYPTSTSTSTSKSTEPQWTEISSSRQAVETTPEITTSTEKLTTYVVIPTFNEETTVEETSPTTSTEPTTTTSTAATTTTTTSPTTTSTTTLPPPTTTEIITTTSTEESPTTPMITTTELLTTTPSTTTSTTTTTTTTTRTTEIDLTPKNNRPVINQRLKKIRITAGTVLSYFIPEDTFTDIEDGTDLVLKFLDSEGLPLKKNFWIQFNERTREIYGLPLEEHVSKWEFLIEATDKEGVSVSDTLEVTVQQHKGRRAVTHEFSLLMRVEKKNEFPTAVDWQLRTLRGLASLFHNKDLTQIVVRQIDFSSEFVTFTWTNDTLPRSYCPKAELDHLLSVMVANKDGDPSKALSLVLAPELRVKNVEYRGIGQCEEKPEPPVAPPKVPPTNFSPIPRNQVDHINAVVGELLVFRVPDDTFYDPEDGDARNLKMSLLTMDRQPLPADHWLQFDVKNQEFFGVPLASDVGRSEYQLVCEDRGGLTANDGLVVLVRAAPRVRYNVEFSMTLETPYETFINSASIKRKFVEKLRDLYRDRDTTHIRISSIMEERNTIVSWHNKTIPTDRCPDKEIKRLRQVLVNDDETYADRVDVIMGPEFPVSAISLTPIGVCQGEFTVVHQPDANPPVDEPPSADASDEYLITFVVPAVIIAAMLALAGVVACVLYRRRRTGKMNVEDDERMNKFRSKGIPVIFQDEIDEKPEGGTKAPVILKEEKPPLAPPEYSKSATPQPEEGNDAPYQPPPPFTQDNGRQPRPKPTPTYRKPPPYVPP